MNLSSLIHASIDVNTLTVSGFSSGGALANVMHFAFSSKVKGGGVFAGRKRKSNRISDHVNYCDLSIPVPFNIAYNLSHRNFIPKYAVTLVISMLGRSQIELQTNIESLAEKGIIDPVSGLVGSKSYVYEGSLDPIIFRCEYISESEQVNEWYSDIKIIITQSQDCLGRWSTPTNISDQM